jgi:hypothetical protein
MKGMFRAGMGRVARIGLEMIRQRHTLR